MEMRQSATIVSPSRRIFSALTDGIVDGGAVIKQQGRARPAAPCWPSQHFIAAAALDRRAGGEHRGKRAGLAIETVRPGSRRNG